MATVRNLVTKWGFQVDLKPVREMKHAIGELKEGIKELGLKAIEAGAILFETAELTASAGKAAALGAAKTGLSTDAFQELAFAAKTAGVSSEGFTHSLAHLNRSVYEAKQGNKEAFKAFVQLGGGVAQAAIKGAGTDEIFSQIAEQIKNTADPAKKSALAMQIFGRAGFELLPILNKGKEGLAELREEAIETGVVIGPEGVENSLKFKESLHLVESQLIGLKNAVGVSLLKPFTQIFKEVSAWIKLNRQFITQNITAFFKGLSNVLTVTLKVTGLLVRRVSELVKPLGGLGYAAKYAFEALALLAGAQILMGIGNVAVKAFETLTTAVTSFSFATLRAGIVSAAIPIAIGLGVLALIAMFEDITGYFQGKDSITGNLIEAVKALDPFFSKFGIWGRMITVTLLTPIRLVVDAFRTLGGVIGAIVGGGGVSGVLDAVKGGLSDFSKPIGNAIGGKDFNLTSSLGFGETQPQVGAPALGAQAQPVQNNIQNAVTVNVPPGTDPTMVGERAQDGVSQAIDKHLRSAHSALVPVGAY